MAGTKLVKVIPTLSGGNMAERRVFQILGSLMFDGVDFLESLMVLLSASYKYQFAQLSLDTDRWKTVETLLKRPQWQVLCLRVLVNRL
jgi:hypothetical protein